MVYRPTARVLTVLELLQSHGRMTGAELARRLAVNIRTVRDYIEMLVDLGIPVEAERGRYGAYRLRPGYKLPPLIFMEDEALALTLSLLMARENGTRAHPGSGTDSGLREQFFSRRAINSGCDDVELSCPERTMCPPSLSLGALGNDGAHI